MLMAQHLPTLEDLEKALATLEEAREAFEVACYDVREALDFTPLTAALAAWRHAADAVNELASAAAADIEMYQGERSERWLASAKGEAVEAWRQALDAAQLGLDPETTLQLDIDLSGDMPQVEFITDPDTLLPATPEVPILDET
jgi:hypothetical protein